MVGAKKQIQITYLKNFKTIEEYYRLKIRYYSGSQIWRKKTWQYEKA